MTIATMVKRMVALRLLGMKFWKCEKRMQMANQSLKLQRDMGSRGQPLGILFTTKLGFNKHKAPYEL